MFFFWVIHIYLLYVCAWECGSVYYNIVSAAVSLEVHEDTVEKCVFGFLGYAVIFEFHAPDLLCLWPLEAQTHRESDSPTWVLKINVFLVLYPLLTTCTALVSKNSMSQRSNRTDSTYEVNLFYSWMKFIISSRINGSICLPWLLNPCGLYSPQPYKMRSCGCRRESIYDRPPGHFHDSEL